MSARICVTFQELLMLKAEARGFSLLPRQPMNSLLAGRYASRLRGRGLSFEELRHYHPGDDVRTIDWKATARYRSTHVRVYTEERERPLLLLVDQRQPMFFGSQCCMKSVAAAELAALGSWKALHASDRVGGIVFNEEELVEIRPHRSQGRVLQLFHAIERMNRRLTSIDSVPDRVGLNDALRGALRVAKHDHLVVLISDLDGADETTKKLATQLAAHNDLLVVVVYDPLGISLSGSEGMLAYDRGSAWPIPDTPLFEASFQEEFQEQLDKWRGIFRNLKIPLLPISTSASAAQQLRALLGSSAK